MADKASSNPFTMVVGVLGLTVPMVAGGVAGGVAAWYLDDAIVSTLRKSKKWLVAVGVVSGIGLSLFLQPAMKSLTARAGF